MTRFPVRLLVAGALAAVAAFVFGSVATAGGTQIPIAGSGSAQTGPFTPSAENGTLEQVDAEDGDEGPDAYSGTISLSQGAGGGPVISGGQKAKSNPTVNSSFEGLNFYQQRYARGGNQFSIEPPDQGLCAGNGFELEAINDVLNVYNAAGQSVLPDNTAGNIVAGLPRNVNHAVDLNSFYGYPPAVNRSTGVQGPELTDPSCIYDAATQRWFVVVLTLDRNLNNSLNLVNHLDIAVSKTADPTGGWNIYKVFVTNDGTNTGGQNPGPYLGDYPHIGADANGFYITTNAYPWNANGFAGAQIYAFSKAQLAAGVPNVTMVHLDTSGRVNAPSEAGATQPGFTVWPAQSAGKGDDDDDASGKDGGTEFFLSANAADEAQKPVTGTAGTRTSNNIVAWALTNTASLNTPTPTLSLTATLVDTETYAAPPKQRQPGSGSPPGVNAPQGFCINNTTTATILGVGCWNLLFTAQPPHTEVISSPDSNTPGCSRSC